MIASFKRFGTWLNSGPIAPWAIAVLTAVYFYARAEVTVSAQGDALRQLQTQHSVDNVVIKAYHDRDMDILRAEVLRRLDSIERKLDSVDQWSNPRRHK